VGFGSTRILEKTLFSSIRVDPGPYIAISPENTYPVANTAKLRSIGQIYVATSGTETSYPSGAPEFTPVSSEVHVARSLVFCVVFCGSLFELFLLAIVLSVLRFTDYDYLFWYLQTRFTLFVLSCQYLPGLFITKLSDPIFVPW
jgi:hypothetical protein